MWTFSLIVRPLTPFVPVIAPFAVSDVLQELRVDLVQIGIAVSAVDDRFEAAGKRHRVAADVEMKVRDAWPRP